MQGHTGVPRNADSTTCTYQRSWNVQSLCKLISEVIKQSLTICLVCIPGYGGDRYENPAHCNRCPLSTYSDGTRRTYGNGTEHGCTPCGNGFTSFFTGSTRFYPCGKLCKILNIPNR